MTNKADRLPARLRSWIRVVFRRSRWEREMREELGFHMQARADDLARGGLSLEDARRRAALEFGGVEGFKEHCRAARGAGPVDEVTRNLRDAWRSARRSPGFVLIALLSLTLGIGANVAMFGLLRQLLLNPLPVRDPQSLHQVVLSTVRQPYYAISYPKFTTLRERFPLFDVLFGWSIFPEPEIVAGDRKETGRLALVTGSYFDGLGGRPTIGRLITPDDDRPGGGANVAVISHRLWQRLFDGNEAALTRTVTLRSRSLTLQVIGVAPREFAGTEPADPVDVFIPIYAMQPRNPNLITGGGLMWMHVMARLKPDVPMETAQTMLRDGWSEIDRAAQAQRGDNTRPEHLMLEDGSHGYSSVRIHFSHAVVVLMALVVIVFLIACANLSSLLFVRASRRAAELALRVALGARRGQIVRQWLTECLLLAIAGGASGILAAYWINSLLLQFVPETNRAALHFRLTTELVLFSTLLSVVAAGLFGWIPTVRASSVQAQEVLRVHGPSVASRRGHVARLVLAGQLAASLVLVVGAVLFARTLWNLNTRSTGFERDTVVYGRAEFFRVQFPRDQISGVVQQIIQTLQSSPHFASVATGPVLSGGAGGWTWARVPGYTFAPDEENVVYNYWVSPGYFSTMSIPLVAGRDFEERDATAKPLPVIVSEKLARHYFKEGSAVGQKIIFGSNPPREIIGVVRDVIDVSPRTGPNELVYHPQSLFSAGNILARAAPGVDAAAAEAHVRSAISAAAKNVPITTGQMESAIQASMNRDRLVTQLSAGLGLLGVLLASIGLFAAVAHWASGRTREIGIRMMLGASRQHVGWMVLREGLSVTALGLAAGVPLSIAAATLIDPLLFGVSARDLSAHALSIVLLTAAGLLAACWPALRAARLNPLEALRYE